MTEHQALSIHNVLERARDWRNVVSNDASRRISGALASGATALRAVDDELHALGDRDWTVSGLVTQLDALTRGARASIRHEADALLHNLDRSPVAAMSYILGHARGTVQAVARTLEVGATRTAHRVTAPSPIDAQGTVPSRPPQPDTAVAG